MSMLPLLMYRIIEAYTWYTHSTYINTHIKHTYIYKCTLTRTPTHTHTHTHTRTIKQANICRSYGPILIIFTRISICIYVTLRRYGWAYVYVRLFVCACVRVSRMYVCKCVCANMCMCA